MYTIVGFKWIYVDSDTYECVIGKSENTERDYVHKLAPGLSSCTWRMYVKFNIFPNVFFHDEKLCPTTKNASLINHFILKIMSLKLSRAEWQSQYIEYGIHWNMATAFPCNLCAAMKFNAKIMRPKQKTMFRID